MVGRGVADGLVSNLQDVVAFFGSENPEELDQPQTTSQHPGGRPWSAMDHLAHLLQRELDFLAIAKRIAAHEQDPVRLGHRGSTPAEQSAFVNRENQERVDSMRGASRAELLDRLTNARMDLISIIAGMSDEELGEFITVTPGRDVAAADLLGAPARHANAHLEMLMTVKS